MSRDAEARHAGVWPDAGGHFGPYGGRYVPETLMEPLRELEAAYAEARRDPAFEAELSRLLRDYVGPPDAARPRRAALRAARLPRLAEARGPLPHGRAQDQQRARPGAAREADGQDAASSPRPAPGQHGVATATVCALLGLECVVYMGTEDMARQAPNVARMRLLGAEVRGVDSGTRTLKDAINEAMRDWVTNVRTTHYLLGSVLGAHPYPAMVRDFQAVIGREARAQVLEADGRLPDLLVACVGGGSNAIGLFFAFLEDAGVRMVGVEAGGRSSQPGRARRPLPDREGRRAPASASSRGRAPTCCRTRPATCCRRTPSRRASTTRRSAPSTRCCTTRAASSTTRSRDDEALAAFHLLGETEGILPALESSHAVAWLVREKQRRSRGQTVIVNLSGRGDKDLGILEAEAADRTRSWSERTRGVEEAHEAVNVKGNSPYEPVVGLLAGRAGGPAASTWPARPRPARTARSSARATPTPRRSSASATSRRRSTRRAPTSATSCGRACT